jgi:hydrogenase-4 membrane subunit HyfE
MFRKTQVIALLFILSSVCLFGQQKYKKSIYFEANQTVMGGILRGVEKFMVIK